jgi:signal transduction histidine kinase
VKLRNRVLRNSVLTVTGVAILAYMSFDWLRERQAERIMRAAIEQSMAAGGRAACEAQAAAFGGGELNPVPPLPVFESVIQVQPQLFAYDGRFQSVNAGAPPFPSDLKEAMQAGAQSAVGWFGTASGIGRQLAVRQADTGGQCAFLLGRLGGFVVPVSTELFRLTMVIVIVAVSTLLAIGPTVARIHRLAAAVKTSAESMYAVPVPETGQDEIGDLERAFNHAGAQVRSHVATIQDREAALRAAVSHTAHDVAVPLTVVQGHLSALQAQLPSDGPAHDQLRGAIRDTHYLAALLRNLWAGAQLDAPAPTLDRPPLDLNALVARVVARHGPLSESLGVDLGAGVPEAPTLVSGDVTLLEQAASNLVHNAIHYGKAGGHVAIILDTSDAGRRFSLRVIDDGPGIPPEERTRLTEPSVRGGAGRRSRPDGQGLGLHIVSQVAARHGFDLRIGESEYGGAEVEISGPCH